MYIIIIYVQYLRPTARNFWPIFFQIRYKQSVLITAPLVHLSKGSNSICPISGGKGGGGRQKFRFLDPGIFLKKKIVISL